MCSRRNGRGKQRSWARSRSRSWSNSRYLVEALSACFKSPIYISPKSSYIAMPRSGICCVYSNSSPLFMMSSGTLIALTIYFRFVIMSCWPCNMAPVPALTFGTASRIKGWPLVWLAVAGASMMKGLPMSPLSSMPKSAGTRLRLTTLVGRAN